MMKRKARKKQQQFHRPDHKGCRGFTEGEHLFQNRKRELYYCFCFADAGKMGYLDDAGYCCSIQWTRQGSTSVAPLDLWM